MPTRRVELGTDHLREARKAAADRTYTNADPLFLADVGERGLLLRVRSAKAEFILKFSGSTRTLATLGSERGDLKPDEIRTIKEARELAQKVRALIKDGVDPKPFLTGRAAGKSDDTATGDAKRKAAVTGGAWIWETLVTEYADKYLSEPRPVRGQIRPPSEKSARGAKIALTQLETENLNGRLLSELGIGDFEEVRDRFATAGRKSASRAFVANAKAAMSFARKTHARKSGLEGAPRWWLDVAELPSTSVSARTRMPSLKDIAQTLYAAEKHRLLEGRKIRRETTETTLCAMWWIALTAQRTDAAMSLEKANVLPWPADQGPANGWKVATWSESAMKSKRYHALPIPPRLVLLLERAMVAGREGSEFVFPAMALRREKIDGHVDQNTFKNVVDRLRGKRKNPKGGKASVEVGRDLLEGVPHYSPHDIRRTFATTCSDLKIRGDAISAALDHAGIETGQKLIRSADITRIAYDYSQRLPLKREAMEAWTNAVFEAVEAEWKRAQPKLKLAEVGVVQMQAERTADLSKGVPFSDREPWYRTMEWQRASHASQKLVLKKSEPQEFDDHENVID
jgi:integrase